MNSINYIKLTEELIKQNKNVLLVDTCCILDIIRSIQREKRATLISTIEILNKFEVGENTFNIILPSLVKDEWLDNATFVKNDTINYIQKFDVSLTNIVWFHNFIFPSNVQHLTYSSFKFEEILVAKSKALIDLSYHLEPIVECINKATYRVIKSIPPSEKGKDSLKDCIIFEEVLFLANNLRSQGFSKKVIFASSNTKEYCDNRTPKRSIMNELTTNSIEIAFSLDHGFNLAK